MDLSAGVLRYTLSSVRATNVQGSSGLPDAPGFSVSLTLTSPFVSRIKPDVQPSHPSSTYAVPVSSCLLVSSSPVSPSTPLSDFPFLGSSQTGESFPLFHVLRSSSGLPLGHLNPFALGRSVSRVLVIQFPNISKLRDDAILVKASTYVMSQDLSQVPSLVGSPVISISHRSLNSSKGTGYATDFVS